ncbi:MAG: cyclic nucleotide-binding domain-containing protein [bacterium]
MSLKKISDIKLFEHLGAVEMNDLSRISRIRQVKEGEVIFKEGEKSKDIYFLLDGRIGIRKKISSGSKTIAIMRKGDIFGEMALFENAPRSATAFAMTQSEILDISGDDFRRFLSEKPEESFGILMKIIAVSSSRLRNMDRYFTTVYEIALQIGACGDTEELSGVVLEYISNSLNITGSFFYSYDMYNDEYGCVKTCGSVKNTQPISSEQEIIKRLKTEKHLPLQNSDFGEGFCFLNTLTNEDGLIGFIGILSGSEFSWEDRVLIGTICNMITPVISNLRMKQAEMMKNRLEEKKWAL